MGRRYQLTHFTKLIFILKCQSLGLDVFKKKTRQHSPEGVRIMGAGTTDAAAAWAEVQIPRRAKEGRSRQGTRSRSPGSPPSARPRGRATGRGGRGPRWSAGYAAARGSPKALTHGLCQVNTLRKPPPAAARGGKRFSSHHEPAESGRHFLVRPEDAEVLPRTHPTGHPHAAPPQ